MDLVCISFKNHRLISENTNEFKYSEGTGMFLFRFVFSQELMDELELLAYSPDLPNKLNIFTMDKQGTTVNTEYQFSSAEVSSPFPRATSPRHIYLKLHFSGKPIVTRTEMDKTWIAKSSRA